MNSSSPLNSFSVVCCDFHTKLFPKSSKHRGDSPPSWPHPRFPCLKLYKLLSLKLQITCSPLVPRVQGNLTFSSSRLVTLLSRNRAGPWGLIESNFHWPSGQALQHTAQHQAAAAKYWMHGRSAEKEQHSDSSSFWSLAYPCRQHSDPKISGSWQTSPPSPRPEKASAERC